jgi:methionine sulfoxide reductase heme-binding subunit
VTFTQLAPYLPWLASRSAGIVAFCLVSASVILGLSMATKVTSVPTRARLRGVHEQLAVAGLVAVAAHGLLLLGDRWLQATPVGLVVPFTLGYRPLFTGLGVIAGWGAALFGLSYYARRRIGYARWRSLHRATFLVWLLGATHAVGAGSDASTLFMRALIVGSAVPIGALLALRLSGGATTPAPARPPAPTPAPAPVAPAVVRPEPLWSRPRN